MYVGQIFLYILENNDFKTNNANLNYYLTQLAVWWYLDLKNGYSNDIDYCDMNFAIVMGGEHSGVSKTLLKLADFSVNIPMFNDFNSLNVSNALSIIVYESVRQRLTKK